MKENSRSRRYRIGEYASYMGVTPDFLKHYEKNNLISAEVQNSGYRYFQFRESCRILECMRLRNYGFTVRDMEIALNQADGLQEWQMLEEKAAALERQVQLETAVLREHRRLRQWMDWMQGKEENWLVQQVGTIYFLPHSNHNDFLKDERIYEILNQWVSWMPVVKSAMQICDPQNPQTDSYWGLLISEANAVKYGLPLGDVVQRVPACKALIYSYAGPDFDGQTDANHDPHHPAYRQAARLGLRPTGAVYKVVLMYARMHQSPRQQYGLYIVPLEE